MSEERWAHIVYGRSYHLDFRFIAVPEDFGEPEINWALPYILATAHKPKKLSLKPRWSLFKNQSHCVVGVTCMVRDLLGEKDISLTKDDKDRPLYIFVGYVAKLTNRKHLIDLPPYNNNSLQDFQSLYDYVRQVWQVRDFHKNSHQSIKTNYNRREFSRQYLPKKFSRDLLVKLNHQENKPDKVFLWQDKPEKNSRLWATSAACSQSTSLCLGNSDEQHCLDNPFLNQTIHSQEILTIQAKLNPNKYFQKSLTEIEVTPTQETISFTEILTKKVKQDIKITQSSASQLKQILINNLSNEIQTSSQKSEAKLALFDDGVQQEFGFKTKVSKSKIVESDWF